MTSPGRRSGTETTLGAAASLLATAILVAAMLPFRARLGASTSGLVLVVPVVAGVALGGWLAGLLAVAVGFFAYDFFFLRPYATLAVSNYRDWVTLGVYVVVMLIVGRVVIALRRARAQARRGSEETGHLLEVSDLLIGDRDLNQLLGAVVSTVQREFHLTSAAVLLPDGDQLRVAAQAGDPPLEPELSSGVMPTDQATRLAMAGRSGLRTLPLATTERSIGALLLSGPALSPAEQRLLTTYANHAALAVERAQLREQALRSQVLVQVDSWRRALLASVAHDLRTPLASIKAALSDLGNVDVPLSTADRQELLATAEDETDRLTGMVGSLLDMYRIEAGTRRLVLESVPAQELVEEALEAIRGRLSGRSLEVEVAPGQRVRVDRHLIVRVLVNLLDNASRHTPPGSPVAIRSRVRDQAVELSVLDRGPGLSPDRMEGLFQPGPGGPPRAGSLAQSGVGLAICRAFVDANGGRLGATARPGGGLEVMVRLPAA